MPRYRRNHKAMKKLFPLTILLVLLISCGAGPGKKATAEKEEWIQLFNGKDLEGWSVKCFDKDKDKDHKKDKDKKKNKDKDKDKKDKKKEDKDKDKDKKGD